MRAGDGRVGGAAERGQRRQTGGAVSRSDGAGLYMVLFNYTVEYFT